MTTGTITEVFATGTVTSGSPAGGYDRACAVRLVAKQGGRLGAKELARLVRDGIEDTMQIVVPTTSAMPTNTPAVRSRSKS